jgi:nucleoside-diphosphate-sugar epimerase
MTDTDTTAEPQTLQVYISGGATNLSRDLTRRLVAAGHGVTVWVATAKQAKAVREDGGLPVYGATTHPAMVADNLTIAEANLVINLAPMNANIPPYVRPDWLQVADQLRQEALTLVEAVNRLQTPPRVIHTSYTFLYADTTDPVGEDAPLRAGDNPFLAAALEAEHAIITHTQATVLRVGYLFSEATTDPIRAVEQMLKRSLTPAYFGKPGAKANWLRTEDLVTALFAAAQAEADGKIYNIVSDTPLSVYDFIAAFAHKLGLSVPSQLPPAIARTLYSKVYVDLVTASTPATNTLARAELGWEPRFADIDAALDDMLLTWRATAQA